MAFMVPDRESVKNMFSNIDQAMVNMTGGCPCRCTNCNSCACGRCYVLEDAIEINIWD